MACAMMTPSLRTSGASKAIYAFAPLAVKLPRLIILAVLLGLPLNVLVPPAINCSSETSMVLATIALAST